MKGDHLMISVIIAGTGSKVPSHRMTNKMMCDLLQIPGKGPDWIEAKTGIKERRYANRIDPNTGKAIPPVKTDIDLVCPAARRAMRQAKVNPGDIDAVVHSTCTQKLDREFSTSATEIHRRLRLRKTKAQAYSIPSGCSGGNKALRIAYALIKGGEAKVVLVTAANTTSLHLNVELYKETNAWLSPMIFGDAGGAVVLMASEDPEDNGKGILATFGGTDGENELMYRRQVDGICDPDDVNLGLVFEIDGRLVKKKYPPMMRMALKGLQKRHPFDIKDIDRFIMHQGNGVILPDFCGKLGIPMDKVAINVINYGNISAATVFVLLDEDLRAGRIKKGDLILIWTVGAGAAYNATLVQM